MSPRAKTLNFTALASAIIVIAGAVWGGGSKVVTIADARYVRTDSFVAYRTGEQLRHLRDSTSVDKKLTAIKAILAGLDSSDRCRRNQTSYCR
jgi:hypothetical protein